MSNEKLSVETATEQFNKFAEFYGFDEEDFSEKDEKGQPCLLDNMRANLVKYVRKGLLELNPDGTAIQNLRGAYSKTSLAYRAVIASDKARITVREDDMALKMYGDVLGNLSGEGAPVILSLGGIDSRAATVLAAFLLIA